MARKPLEGETREHHTKRVCAELTAIGQRLGIDVTRLCVELTERDPAQTWRDTAYLKVESGAWAVDASITVKLIQCAESYFGYRAETEVSWSSTGRNIASALHAVANYQRAIEMCAVIEGLVQ